MNLSLWKIRRAEGTSATRRTDSASYRELKQGSTLAKPICEVFKGKKIEAATLGEQQEPFSASPNGLGDDPQPVESYRELPMKSPIADLVGDSPKGLGR
uniref:Uncharacterized protein n=1 Tax=Solanum tuberosum TaxID=4113 RepID=M1DZE4_SOLTU